MLHVVRGTSRPKDVSAQGKALCPEPAAWVRGLVLQADGVGGLGLGGDDDTKDPGFRQQLLPDILNPP